LTPKCNKIDFNWNSTPDPTGVAYSAPPDSLTGLKWGLLLRQESKREGVLRERRKGEGSRGPHFYDEVYIYVSSKICGRRKSKERNKERELEKDREGEADMVPSTF